MTIGRYERATRVGRPATSGDFFSDAKPAISGLDGWLLGFVGCFVPTNEYRKSPWMWWARASRQMQGHAAIYRRALPARPRRLRVSAGQHVTRAAQTRPAPVWRPNRIYLGLAQLAPGWGPECPKTPYPRPALCVCVCVCLRAGQNSSPTAQCRINNFRSNVDRKVFSLAISSLPAARPRVRCAQVAFGCQS